MHTRMNTFIFTVYPLPFNSDLEQFFWSYDY